MIRVLTISLTCLFLAACGAVNQSFQIDDGSVVNGDLSTVNGSIRVGNDSSVSGKLSAVNGSIELGERSRSGAVTSVNGSVRIGAETEVASVENVNGSLSLGDGVVVQGKTSGVNGRVRIGQSVRIGGDVETVNGSVEIGAGSTVAGRVATVNGDIGLSGAEATSIVTTSGSILLEEGSRVGGELRVRRPRSATTERTPDIVIGPDVEVVGPLVFEREVRLRVHDSARIGEVSGAEVERYSGPTP